MWVFSHNIMFDLWILGWPEMLESGQSVITRSKVQGPPAKRDQSGKHKPWKGMCSIERGSTIIHTVTRGMRVNFVDSYNYYRCSVASLGESIKLPKLPMPSQEAADAEWYAYCWRDVDIIREGITSLMREWKASDLGNWQPTAPSLSFSSYRHRFAPKPFVCHNDAEVGKLERDGYYDGRTQPFRIGKINGPVYHVDVNSLYPSVMKGNEYPHRAQCNTDGEPIVIKEAPAEELEWLLERHSLVANVKISTDVPYYPYRFAGRVVYPVGQFNTTLCTPELELAVARGDVAFVNWCVLYERHRMFDLWVDYWTGRRQYHASVDNHASAECCKVIMNSLAGKLGQRSRHWVNNAKIPVNEPWDTWIHLDTDICQPIKCRSIGYSAQTQIDAGDSPHALVATAAHVSSFARMRMLDVVLKLPHYSVYYIGNDSLLLSESGYFALLELGEVNAAMLGKFRHCATYNEINIYGPRDYDHDGETTKAGLPKGATKTGERSWDAEIFEDADSLISRHPNMSVRTHSVSINGSQIHPGIDADADGWTRWPVAGTKRAFEKWVDIPALWGYDDL